MRRIVSPVDDTEETRKEIGARIAHARIGAGYENAAEFARQVGVQPNTVYRWERGEIVPDIFRLESVSRTARVSTDWILRGSPTSGREVLEGWRETPRGKTATEGAMRFLETLPLDGYTPTFAFYDLALLAYEQGLSPAEAALAARVTEVRRDV